MIWPTYSTHFPSYTELKDLFVLHKKDHLQQPTKPCLPSTYKNITTSGTCPILLGVMIDLDEAGVYPNETNRKYGKSVAGKRCREIGTHVRDSKLNILIAVAGENDADGISDRWYDLWEDGGTTNESFYQFLKLFPHFEIYEGWWEFWEIYPLEL